MSRISCSMIFINIVTLTGSASRSFTEKFPFEQDGLAPAPMEKTWMISVCLSSPIDFDGKATLTYFLVQTEEEHHAEKEPPNIIIHRAVCGDWRVAVIV